MQNLLYQLRKKPIIYGLAGIILLGIIFFVISLSSPNKKIVKNTANTTDTTNTTNTTTVTQNGYTQPTTQIEEATPTEVTETETGPKVDLPDDEKERVWDKVDFNACDMNGLNAYKTVLKDGSVKYS
jgi:hypothetical protein